jgi:hypothetical protein
MLNLNRKPKTKNAQEKRMFKELVKKYRDILQNNCTSKTEVNDYSEIRNEIKLHFANISHNDWKDYLLFILDVLGRPCEIPEDADASNCLNLIFQKHAYILADEIGMK